MKIAYLLASSMISGGGKVILQQADELGRRGHEVAIVCQEGAPDWYSLRHARFESSAFEASMSLREAEIVVATFWTTIEPAISNSSGALFHLYQGLETLMASPAQKETIEAISRKIPRKIIVSPHLRGLLEEQGFEEVEEVGQTFEAEGFRVVGRRFDGIPLRVLLPGIFIPGTVERDIKGVGSALEALTRLRASGARFRVLRVAAEPMAAQERKLSVVDEYHRSLSPRRMPALLAYADVFLGPNHESEGFGLPSLEALAAGLPAALSDTPSHRAMAGDAAVFFPPRDPQGIADALSSLLSEPELRQRLSAEGPVRAARFRTSDVGERLEGVFRRATRV